ncbi:MAG: hypothetical protein G01um1014106_539 [Parcubacteria group bacterium Gr01-1014_106]|nr:MAG: hypothetical protein G01um1014106_539 [Parcubacteria group bacterium Gr01-1014_106]
MNLKSTAIAAVVGSIVFGLWVWIAISLGISGIYLLSCLLGAFVGAILIGAVVFQKVATGSWSAFGVIAIAIILGVVWPLVLILAGVTVQAATTADTQQQASEQPGEKKPVRDLVRKTNAAADFGNVYTHGYQDGQTDVGKRLSAQERIALEQWPRTIEVDLPAQGVWVLTDIELEPGMAYPVTGKLPPCGILFDFDINKVGRPGAEILKRPFLDRVPTATVLLRRNLIAYLNAKSPGKLSYYVASDENVTGTWTFEVGKPHPTSQVREVALFHERLP